MIKQGDRVEVYKGICEFYQRGASGIVVMRNRQNLLVKFDRGEFKRKHGNDNMWHVHVSNVIKIEEKNKDE